jgi:hypothetical protein
VDYKLTNGQLSTRFLFNVLNVRILLGYIVKKHAISEIKKKQFFYSHLAQYPFVRALLFIMNFPLLYGPLISSHSSHSMENSFISQGLTSKRIKRIK